MRCCRVIFSFLPAAASLAATVSPRLVQQRFGELPLRFEPATGAAGPRAQYGVRGQGFALSLGPAGFVIQRRKDPVGVRFLGADRRARPEALEELPGKTNYLLGSDPRGWRTGVPAFARIRYESVYPGVDLIYYGNQRLIEHDFHVRPGADPARIRLAFDGIRSMRLDAAGDLILEAGGGEVSLKAPFAYQEEQGVRVRVPASYRILAGNQVAFRIGAWDPGRALTIDPVLVWSSYAGGSDDDRGLDIAVDGQGNSYVVGDTISTNFPTVNAVQRTFGGKGSFSGDAFVAKLSADGRSLMYATYLGGSGDERSRAIAVDMEGNAYVTGDTDSRNFPVTMGSFRPTYNGGTYDAFVTKLNATGSMLVYSTYLGGADNDFALDIGVDAMGNAHVAGRTFSTNFPTRNPIQANFGGRIFDAFITKLNATGSALVYSTYLGGSLTDEAYGIAVDGAGNACVAGFTNSGDFPTARPLQGTRRGGFDAFIAKLPPAGDRLIYSTFFGGRGDEFVNAAAMDASGNCYITGLTDSTDYPTMNAFQGAFGGRFDAFVTKIDSTGGALVYSTYLGGAAYDQGSGIAVDGMGMATLVGATESTNFPLADAVQREYRGGSREGTLLTLQVDSQTPGTVSFRLINVSPDGFATRLSADGRSAVYSTYLGGTGDDLLFGVAVDGAGNTYLTGETTSTDFPSMNPLQPANAGGRRDAVMVKFSNTPARPTLSNVLAAGFQPGSLAPESLAAAFGPNLATTTESAASTPLPTTLGGTKVAVTDSGGTTRDAGLIAVSPGQVNYLMPPGTAPGPATVKVTNGAGAEITGTVMIEPVAPGLFGLNTAGLAAAFALKVGADGTQTTQPVFQADDQGRIVPLPIEMGDPTDQVILLLFGTGFRFQTSMSAMIGGVGSNVLFGGPQGGFDGLDQANVSIPRRLIGRGDVPIEIIANGKRANVVRVTIGGTPLPPMITAVNPAGAEAGQTVAALTIAGDGLQNVTAIEFMPPDGITVTNVRAGFNSVTAQMVIAPTASLGGRQVVVVSPQGISNPLPFTVLAPTLPRITSLNPANGVIGQTINTLTIGGENFGGVSALNFSPATGLTVTNIVATATQVTARLAIAVSAALGTRQLSVTSPRGMSNAVAFAIQAPGPPVISAVNPTSAEAGDTLASLTIMGDNLQTVTSIELTPSAGITVTNVRPAVNSVMVQIAIALTAAPGARQVAAVSPQGRSNTVQFMVLASTRPRIDSVNPAGGGIGQTVVITIVGQNLQGATAVNISPSIGLSVSNIAATATQVTASVSISFTATIGTRQLSVATPQGTSNSLSFAVQPPPPGPPVIDNASLSISGSAASYTRTGAFDFADGDGDITSAAKVKFAVSAPGASCTTTVSGSFLNRPGQNSGRITYSLSGGGAQLTFSGSVSVSFSLIDAAGNESNVVLFTLTRWYC